MADEGWSTWSDEDDGDWDHPGAVGGHSLLVDQLSHDPVLNGLDGVLRVVPDGVPRAVPDDVLQAVPEAVVPDPEFGGEWRPRGRFKGNDEEGRRRYPGPRPPRRDCNVDFGLNSRRGGMDNRVFVSSLPFKVFEDELEQFFTQFGPVKTCQVVRERVKNQGRRDDRSYWSKGIGFVQFENVEGMNAALNATTEQLQLGGRQVKVAKARGQNGDLGAKDDDDKSKDAEEGSQESSSERIRLDVLEGATGALTVSSNTDDDDSSFVSKLPEPVVLKIFSFLKLREKVALELVSRRCRRLAQMSWASLTELVLPDFSGLYAFRTMIDDRMFMKFLGRTSRSNLRKLDLSRSGLGFHALRCIGKSCPNLEFLDLSGTKVSLESLREISNGCPKLRDFSLRESKDVKEKALWYILKDCRSLERLDIRGCSRIVGNLFHLANDRLISVNLERCLKLKDESVAKLAANCPAMEELNLSNCIALTPEGIAKVANLPRLRSLIMRQMNFPPGGSTLVSSIRPSEFLRDLDLSQNRCVGIADLDVLYSRCGQLKRLNFSCCYLLNGLSFQTLCLSLPSLEYLNLSYIEVNFATLDPSPFLNGQRRSCFLVLEEAILAAVPRFDNEGFQSLLKFPALKFLDVSGNYELTILALDNYKIYDTQLRLSEIAHENRRIHRLKLKVGGTGLSRADLEARSDMETLFELCWFDSSIKNLRQDRHLIEYDDYEDYVDYDDEDGDSFGAGGDLDDFGYLDPMEEFERNWVS